MTRVISINLTLLLILSTTIFPVNASAPGLVFYSIPSFSIIKIIPDISITIRTYNFPAHDTFDVYLGYIGTRALNGYKVATISSGAGGSFLGTFNIPPELKGLYQIAVRLQSTSGSKYYAYNWFYNNLSGSGTGGDNPSSNKHIPTVSAVSVVRDRSVTVRARNFPGNLPFDVLMGHIGTHGANGLKVATITSDPDGSFTATYPIPGGLAGSYQIAIRLQAAYPSGPSAYNWFYNATTVNPGGDQAIHLVPSYTDYPKFHIVSVVRNTTVTFQTASLPKNDQFDVFMGPMGTRGVNGYYVSTFPSGAGGTISMTLGIPAELRGSYQVALRLQSKTGSGYYAYNWFYNLSRR